MTEFMDTGVVNGRNAAFDRQHGASVFIDGWFVYADGATRERDQFGLMMDPPADPWERARKISLHHRVIYERALKEFDEARHGYRILINNNLKMRVCGPAPAVDEAIAELKRLRNTAKRAKDNYDKALAAVEAARPKEDRAAERVDQLNRNDNEDLLAAIEKVEL